MDGCIFCKIVAGAIPCAKVYEDDDILAFRDIAPAAPVHVLFIPKRHFANLGAAVGADAGVLGKMLLAIGNEAAKLGLGDGYRVVANCGPAGGQTVDHFHLHLLGGRDMKWPPG